MCTCIHIHAYTKGFDSHQGSLEELNMQSGYILKAFIRRAYMMWSGSSNTAFATQYLLLQQSWASRPSPPGAEVLRSVLEA